MSKDLDVALWQDYRVFHGKSALPDAIDFVLVNNLLHDDFDSFKRKEVKPQYSYVQLNELVLYCFVLQFSNLFESSRIMRYGKYYLELQASELDKFISWVYEMREVYKIEGENTFEISKIQTWLSNSKLSQNIVYTCCVDNTIPYFTRKRRLNDKEEQKSKRCKLSS